YYVLIDMQGFSDLIDAMGGIHITLEERVAWGSNEDEYGNSIPPEGYLEAGEHHMDGDTALTYARTRYGTSDYQRMQHQRQVQEAMLEQFTPATVLSNFVEIAAAGKQVVRTDIPQQMLAYFVQLAAKSKELPIQSFDLTPPEVDPEAPDYGLIRETVHGMRWPPAPETPAGQPPRGTLQVGVQLPELVRGVAPAVGARPVAGGGAEALGEGAVEGVDRVGEVAGQGGRIA